MSSTPVSELLVGLYLAQLSSTVTTMTGAPVRRSIPMVADGLGLDAFPAHLLEPEGDMGDHIPGFAVTAWLTRYPVEQWGVAWLERGTMALRYRRGLHVGDPLVLTIRASEGELALEVTDAEGVAVATATAGLASSPPRVDRFEPTRCPDPPLRPYAGALAGQSIGTLETDFVAARDLAFVDRLALDDPWRAVRSAHPAYLVSVANLLVRQAVGFTDGRWTHAGSATTNYRPIDDGARLVLTGRIVEIIGKPAIDFAIAEIVVVADGVLAMLLRHTFVCERPTLP